MSRSFQACIVYISEGRNTQILQSFQEFLHRQKGMALLNTTTDKPYNRTGFTLVSDDSSKLVKATVRLIKDAFRALDLTKHTASHPRLGLVDHVSCHNLDASTSIAIPIELAQQIGQAVGRGQDAVPVFLYGEASPLATSLAELRRKLGYFQGSAEGAWTGAGCLDLKSSMKPDFGPAVIDRRLGITLIGATTWITNYNVLIDSSDMRLARSIAKQTSERGGGIREVQAMALPHEKGIEIACNLLGSHQELIPAVDQHIESLCAGSDIKVLDAYRIGKAPEEYMDLARHALDQANN